MQGCLDVDQNDRIFLADSHFRPFRSIFDPILRSGNQPGGKAFTGATMHFGGWAMGRGLLLWLIGIPLPIILVIWLFGGLS